MKEKDCRFRDRWHAFQNGFRDGWNQPIDLSVGMTYPCSRCNEAYDRGVNLGQMIGKPKARFK